MSDLTKSYSLIHLAVILFGFTAILGVWIDLEAVVLVWWRVLIAAIGFTFFTKGLYFLKEIPQEKIVKYAFIGVVIAIHWFTFFLSIKLAGASIGLVCYATTCLFVSIIEPLLLKQKFNTLDFSVALIIVPGMWLVVESVESTKWWGIVIGLVSASLAALFSSLNKKYISGVSVWQLSWIEMVSAWITMGLIIIFMKIAGFDFTLIPSMTDWVYLLILGFGCTTIAHAMALFALKQISAFSLNLIANLEPVYGILFAIVLLKENKSLDIKFYIGAALIILSVFTYPIIKKYVHYASR